jgi:hypothetical protein
MARDEELGRGISLLIYKRGSSSIMVSAVMCVWEICVGQWAICVQGCHLVACCYRVEQHLYSIPVRVLHTS